MVPVLTVRACRCSCRSRGSVCILAGSGVRESVGCLISSMLLWKCVKIPEDRRCQFLWKFERFVHAKSSQSRVILVLAGPHSPHCTQTLQTRRLCTKRTHRCKKGKRVRAAERAVSGMVSEQTPSSLYVADFVGFCCIRTLSNATGPCRS